MTGGSTSPSPEQESKKVRPDTPESEEALEGALWERALDMARQEGRSDNEAYVTAIFKRLAGGVDNG